MPTFDGGHCFLTALLPIKTGEVVSKSGLISSPVHMVRDALSILPVAQQSPATVSAVANSPFSRNNKTHFCRMAVIDDFIFNGRTATDGIVDTLRGSDPTLRRPVDQLPCPYLLLVVDFDAPEGTGAELRAYLGEVWTQMGDDLAPVFENCFGYREKAVSAEGFADYIISCQRETIMSFNDYWQVPPPLKSAPLKLWLALATFAAAGSIFVLIELLNAGLRLLAVKCPAWLYGTGILAICFLSVGAALLALYAMIMARGAQRFPAAPDCDLRSVLKALYLQRALIGFVMHHQGRADQDLYDSFGAFLAKMNIGNLDSPTQLPGTLGK